MHRANVLQLSLWQTQSSYTQLPQAMFVSIVYLTGSACMACLLIGNDFCIVTTFKMVLSPLYGHLHVSVCFLHEA